jgi:hypothetical protein
MVQYDMLTLPYLLGGAGWRLSSYQAGLENSNCHWENEEWKAVVGRIFTGVSAKGNATSEHSRSTISSSSSSDGSGNKPNARCWLGWTTDMVPSVSNFAGTKAPMIPAGIMRSVQAPPLMVGNVPISRGVNIPEWQMTPMALPEKTKGKDHAELAETHFWQRGGWVRNSALAGGASSSVVTDGCQVHEIDNWIVNVLL